MGILRAIFRVTVAALALVVATVVILLLAPLPFKARGVRLSAWPTTLGSRFLLRLFNVQVDFPHAARLRRHRGFVFPNHVSALDILTLLAVVPVRFLAKMEVRRWPFIGWMAVAVGTVFVDRSSKASRQAARQALTEVDYFPPVAVFPEGGILPPPDEINPFRYGAFEIVVNGRIPFIPLVLVYEPLEIAYWGDEPLLTALWRMAACTGPVTVHAVALKTVQPDADDTAVELATQTHSAMSGILNHVRRGTKVLADGL